MGGNGARVDARILLSTVSGQPRAPHRPTRVHSLARIEVTVQAPAGWCLAALLGSVGDEPPAPHTGSRTIGFELSGAGRRWRGTKFAEVEPLRVHTSLLSGPLPWFEEIVEFVPAGPERTEIRWSAALDPGDTIVRRLRVRLLRRWLAQDARSRLDAISRAAAERLIPRPSSQPVDRVPVGA